MKMDIDTGILDVMDLLVLHLLSVRSIPFSFSCTAGSRSYTSRDPLETGLWPGEMRMPGVRLGNKGKREAEYVFITLSVLVASLAVVSSTLWLQILKGLLLR